MRISDDRIISIVDADLSCLQGVDQLIFILRPRYFKGGRFCCCASICRCLCSCLICLSGFHGTVHQFYRDARIIAGNACNDRLIFSYRMILSIILELHNCHLPLFKQTIIFSVTHSKLFLQCAENLICSLLDLHFRGRSLHHTAPETNYGIKVQINLSDTMIARLHNLSCLCVVDANVRNAILAFLATCFRPEDKIAVA